MSDLHGLTRSGAPAAAGSTVAAPRARWKTRVLLPGIIGLIVVVLLGVTSARTFLPTTAVRVVPVVVKSVQGASGTVTVQAPGWLEPDPYPYYVTALADGIVDEILVFEGEPVARDQVVARLVDDDARLALLGAAAELTDRRAAMQTAEARREAARLTLESLVDRTQALAAGEAAVEIAAAEIEEADAMLLVEQARLREIEDEYGRKRGLTESQAVSEAAVARLGLRRDAQAAVVEAARARRAVLQGKRRAAEADLQAARRHRELLIVEREAVALADAAVASAAAAAERATVSRDEAALRLARMEVRSPVDGIVMRRLASPGSRLSSRGDEHAAHVMHAYDPASMQVRVDVPLADAALVSVGQGAEVTVEVLPESIFTGVVSRIVHEANLSKNTVEVKVALDAPDPALRPEMLARVRFLARRPTADAAGGPSRNRLFVPRGLVRSGSDGTSTTLVVAQRVGSRGRVERRTVVAGGQRIDDWIEIESGLRPGDLLVADPGPGLEAGDRVRVVGEAGDALGTGG